MADERRNARLELRHELRRELLQHLSATGELRWGSERMHALAETIRATSQTLADVAAVRLAHDDAEPDFFWLLARE